MLRTLTAGLLLCIAATTPRLHAQTTPDLVAQGDTLVARGKFKEARKLFDEALATEVRVADAYVGRAFCRAALAEKPDAIIEDLSLAIQKDPDHYRAYVNRAAIYGQLRMFDRAIADLGEQIRTAPNDSARVEGYGLRAASHGSIRQFDEAVADHLEALRIMPGSVANLNDLAMTYGQMGDHVNSELYMHRFIEAAPDDFIGPMNMAHLLGEQGRHAEALVWFQKAETLGCDHAYMYNNRGYSHLKMGNTKAALKDIRFSLKKAPDNAYAYRNLALTYHAMNKPKQACEAVNKALSLGFAQQYGNELNVLGRTVCP